MFENLKKINIRGACFVNSTELEVFKTDPLSVIYGRNGSGKSTIGISFQEMLKSEEGKNPLFDVSSDIGINESHNESVHIFNEDFVNNEVRIQNDGITTIVMLGEQVELDNQISQKKAALQLKQKELDDLIAIRRRFEDGKDNTSPDFYFKRLKEAMSSDFGWAEIDRQSKENRAKSAVNAAALNMLMSVPEPSESVTVLYESLKEDLDLFNKSKNARPIVWTRLNISVPRNLNELGDLLSQPLEKPALSEREVRLLDMLARYSGHQTEATKRLLNDGMEFCPLCLREITNQNRSEIAETLRNILNEEAAKYQQLITHAQQAFSVVQVSLPIFGEDLNDKELNQARMALDNFNGILEEIQSKINQRTKNIYQPVEMPFLDSDNQKYADALTHLEASLAALDQCVDRFNDSVNRRVQLKNQIQSKNNSLARKRHSDLLSAYKKANIDKAANLSLLEGKRKECEALEAEINELKSRNEDTNMALSYINDLLQYVFYSKDKFCLEAGSNCYRLKIKGRSVRPRNISVGERNVLGLCYFFAKIFSGKTESARYSTEYLLVIDDPVSSFDYGNRIGVMSLLRYQFNLILKGNPNSRILVMSHDLQSVFDLLKIRNEVTNPKDGKKFYLELSKGELHKRECDNEYKKLIKCVYDYAMSQNEDLDDVMELGIGNIMRRILEAFSTFNFNASFEEVLRKTSLIERIPEEKRPYYESFMNRLILNTESHTEEATYTLTGINVHFTREEKVQTAKSVLLFLSYISHPHLSSYLKENQLQAIEDWKSDEANWL